MNHRHLKISVAAAVLAVLSACASTPPHNAALDQARTRYETARADAQVGALAADEIGKADGALKVADQALAERKPKATVDHLAYMASQHVVLAQATAASRAAQAVTANAGKEREALRLQVRTAEADAAQRQLASSQQANAQSARDLADADANARRDQATMDAGAARVAALESQLADLNAKQTDRGLVVTLGDMLFDTGRSELLPGGSRNVAKLAAFFAKNPDRTASIEGHTDNVGSASMNYALADRRAHAVMAALVGMGVPGASLSTRALGADMPTASNDTPTGRQMNRRVEIVIGKSTAVAAAP